MSYVCYIDVSSVKQCHQNGGFKRTVECSECCTASCFEIIGFFSFLGMKHYYSTICILDQLPESCFMTCNRFL